MSSKRKNLEHKHISDVGIKNENFKKILKNFEALQKSKKFTEGVKNNEFSKYLDKNYEFRID